jgi:hypothetical protein
MTPASRLRSQAAGRRPDGGNGLWVAVELEEYGITARSE